MDRRFLATVALSSCAMFAGVWAYAGGSRFYPSCDWAWSAGAAPIHRGQAGYRTNLDGDGDGIACEPHLARVPHGGGHFHLRPPRRR